MAATSRSTRTATELQMPKRWKERETSPDRTRVWTEPSSNKIRSSDRRVPVIYYLSRNGQLEHPHFMEVPLSCPDGGLYLRDVINRLNFLRGKGMASLYSWSSKRSYKNGYVWHDLSENDFIYPAHGQEYILKGSELLEGGTISKSDETVMSANTIKPPPETPRKHHGDNHDFAAATAARRRRNQSWTSFDLHEYKVYTGESTERAAADASTQTDDRRRRRRAIKEIEEVDEDTEMKGKRPYDKEPQGNQSTELSTDEISEISPPPSDSSPETLETLLKADGRLILRSEPVNEDPTPSSTNHLSGRGKASTVLMQLLSCGSIGFKDCGPGHGKENGFSLVSHYKVRLPRAGGQSQVDKDAEDDTVSSLASGFGGRVKLEDKEYFSGSAIETKKDEFPALKRSSSYNADRSSRLELGVKEMEGSRAKCIPRKAKSASTKKESNTDVSCSTSSSSITRSSQHGSKRMVVQQ